MRFGANLFLSKQIPFEKSLVYDHKTESHKNCLSRRKSTNCIQCINISVWVTELSMARDVGTPLYIYWVQNQLNGA